MTQPLGSIGQFLRDVRTYNKRTLKYVAEDAGCSVPYLSDIERGRRDIPHDKLDIFANAYEIPVVHLLSRYKCAKCGGNGDAGAYRALAIRLASMLKGCTCGGAVCFDEECAFCHAKRVLGADMPTREP